MTRLLQGRAFGFVVDDYHVHDDLVWRRVRQFLRGLHGITGLPGEEAKMTLFLGNYARTPFGLHRGRSANFMFVVDGLKRIRAWPDAFSRGKPDMTNRLDYERYNDASVVLDARPGEVIFWPASYWHIGRTPAARSIAISLALFMEPQPGADLAIPSSRRSLSVRAPPSATADRGRSDHDRGPSRSPGAAADRTRAVAGARARRRSPESDDRRRVRRDPPPAPARALGDDDVGAW